jgi:hypothetical protein
LRLRFQITRNNNRNLFDFAGASKVTLDYNKYQSSREIYLTGLNNYTLFQKFSNFRWPAWINAITDPSQGAASFTPLMLINAAMRDSIYFTNLLSDDGLHIDPAGMISPSYDNWSIETWILSGGALYRPADDWTRVKQDRDTKNSLVYSTWENAICKIQHTIYGARSSVDEAVIETECFVKERKQASIIFVARPYDLQHLGGIESVEFLKDSNCLNINGKKSICFSARPDFFLTGGDEGGRDIDPAEEDHKNRCTSSFGMATMGCGFALKKGENRFVFRVALDGRGGIAGGKYDYARVKEDFTAFTSVRIRGGANASFSDRLLQNWFYGAKISLLSFSLKHIRRDDGSPDYRAAFYVIFGCNRMGYFVESHRYIDHLIKSFSPDEKNITFDAVIDACSILNSIADYFVHTRDTAFIQDRFDFIKKKAFLIHDFSRKLKKPGALSRNSIPCYFIAEEHSFDHIAIAHALGQYSYMARCLGIFGDEIKFKKESDRIAGILSRAAFAENAGRPENEFVCYNLVAGFPLRVDILAAGSTGALLERVRGYFGSVPPVVKSLGLDVFLSLVAACNMIILRDPKGYEALEKLLRMKNRTYVLPEFLNPATGRANWGDGASMAVAAMLFAAVRCLLFVDHPERLEIFPVPRPEWFEAGHEIKVEDAPSRFGLISIRMVSTVNEIQVHFDKLPKFVPPDILIHLPYKTKIKQEDDFILKKEDDTSVIINGWPSIVRFIRK